MNTLIPKAEQRCHTYKFLAECFYIPDAERIGLLHSFRDRAPELYGELSQFIPSPDSLQDYIVEYSKLFLGPLNILAPPYGSIYLEGRNKLMGESTYDVIKWYESEKLDLTINDVADHIAFELEFMYHLALEELKAGHEFNEDLVERYHKKQRNFLELHLGSWIEPFSLKMEAAAETRFYRKIAELTRDFITEDERHLCSESISLLN